MTDWATSTPAGYYIRNAWDVLNDTYTTKVPGHIDQLRKLSNRPIGG